MQDFQGASMLNKLYFPLVQANLSISKTCVWLGLALVLSFLHIPSSNFEFLQEKHKHGIK